MSKENFGSYEYINAEAIKFDKEFQMLVIVLPKSTVKEDACAIRISKDKLLHVLELEPIPEMDEIKQVLCQLQKFREDKITRIYNYIKEIEKYTLLEANTRKKIEEAETAMELRRWIAYHRALKAEKNTLREVRHAIRQLDMEEGKLKIRLAELERVSEQ